MVVASADVSREQLLDANRKAIESLLKMKNIEDAHRQAKGEFDEAITQFNKLTTEFSAGCKKASKEFDPGAMDCKAVTPAAKK
jgi:hypothetical protein